MTIPVATCEEPEEQPRKRVSWPKGHTFRRATEPAQTSPPPISSPSNPRKCATTARDGIVEAREFHLTGSEVG